MTTRPFKNQQKIKDEQINCLLADLEQSLDQYKVSIQIETNNLPRQKEL